MFVEHHMDKIGILEEDLSSSFWFIPGILVALSIPAALFTLSIDEQYISELERTVPGLFGGGSEAARELLSTIAGSLITVISIAFSITIVALQQASTQYSPRVLRNFTKDRGNQIVLGVYAATFTYALLILRSVRTSTDDAAGFIPALSISFALILTLACIGLLIYFISHVSASLQVEYIISRIHEDLIRQIDTLYPEQIGVAVDDNRQPKDIFSGLNGRGDLHTVRAQQAGFIRAVNENVLSLTSKEGVRAVYIMPHVGEFVLEGAPIITIGVEGPIDSHLESMLKQAVIVDSQRSVEQDPLFAIRQLVDVALRALSPSMNDPTTAEYCLYYLGDTLSKLANREFPSKQRYLETGIDVVANRPNWPDFVAESFSQIRIAASDNLHVSNTLVEVIEKIAGNLPQGNRWEPLLEQLQEIRHNIDKLPVPQADITALLTEISKAEQTLRSAA